MGAEGCWSRPSQPAPPGPRPGAPQSSTPRRKPSNTGPWGVPWSGLRPPRRSSTNTPATPLRWPMGLLSQQDEPRTLRGTSWPCSQQQPVHGSPGRGHRQPPRPAQGLGCLRAWRRSGRSVWRGEGTGVITENGDTDDNEEFTRQWGRQSTHAHTRSQPHDPRLWEPLLSIWAPPTLPSRGADRAGLPHQGTSAQDLGQSQVTEHREGHALTTSAPLGSAHHSPAGREEVGRVSPQGRKGKGWHRVLPPRRTMKEPPGATPTSALPHSLPLLHAALILLRATWAPRGHSPAARL